MKSVHSTSSAAVLFLAMISCSPAEPGTTGTGGATTGTGGATTGTGGATTGTGGATTGTGGATTGTGGATTGTGGANTGTGGANTGTGGATTGTGGATTGTGGATTGTGGAGTGTGGRGTGGAGTGGAAGTGTGTGGRGTGGAGTGGAGTGGAGTGGAAGAGSLTSITGAFDGYLFTAQCGDGGTGYDCLNSGCSGSSKTTEMNFAIGGTVGTTYNVTINVKGIVEAKNYSNCTRRAGTAMTFTASGGDFWCVGGTIPSSSYNTYELNVFPTATGGTAMGYRLNARNGTGENHESWPLNFNATFPVVGGGRIQFRVFDSNCRQIMNCGPGTGGSVCSAPVTLSLAGAMPPPPATFTQPFRGTQASATGQWVFIDVTNVVAM